jgi:ABC-2 type transport system permease protein
MSDARKKPRGFAYQIIIEIKKLFKSKFNIILAILILLGAIVFPIVSKTQSKRGPQIYYGGAGQDDLNVNGQIIEAENPQYWEIRNLQDNIDHIKRNATTKADDLALEFMNILLDNAVLVAMHVESYEDYRYELTWRRQQLETEKFIYEHLDIPKEDLMEAIQYRMYMEPTEMDRQYYDLSQIEVLEKLDETEAMIEMVDEIIVKNDHIVFYEFQIEYRNSNKADSLDEIESLENDILENPDKEEMYSEQIEQRRKNIAAIDEIDIPLYQYRIEHDIVPNSDDWRDTALNKKRNALSSIMYNEMMTEEQFEEEEHMRRQYKTYAAYKKNWQKEMDEQTHQLYVAERSLETGKPDMSFVDNGTRKKKVGFLWYSLVIAVLAAVVGGGLMAKEYQSGTIRLLLIRPKKRIKIVLSKFLALMAVCLGLYVAADLLNGLTNGIAFGFSDYGFPNYTISSGANGVGFLGYYLSKFFICFISVFFAGAVAYFFSLVIRNTALAVAIPLVCFVGSLMVVWYVGANQTFSWLAYTPVPYVNFSQYYIGSTLFEPILGLGIPMMIVLGVIFVAAGIFISEKRDIAN